MLIVFYNTAQVHYQLLKTFLCCFQQDIIYNIIIPGSLLFLWFGMFITQLPERYKLFLKVLQDCKTFDILFCALRLSSFCDSVCFRYF